MSLVIARENSSSPISKHLEVVKKMIPKKDVDEGLKKIGLVTMQFRLAVNGALTSAEIVHRPRSTAH